MTTTTGSRFYVYAFFRKDGTPYYIGKGQGNRINDPKGRCFGLAPRDRRKVLVGSLTEVEAFEYEIALISLLGRKDLGKGCLRNLTDGGDGVSGAVVSPETRAKISAAKTNPSAEIRSKISAALTGCKRSPEHRAKIGAANKRRTFSAKTRAKYSAAAAAREAARRAVREALSGQLSLFQKVG